MATTITVDGVRHVANLARLEFNDEETAHFTEQLARILDYIGKLNELADRQCATNLAHPSAPNFYLGMQKMAHFMSLSQMSLNPPTRSRMFSKTHLNPEDGYFGVPRVVDSG